MVENGRKKFTAVIWEEMAENGRKWQEMDFRGKMTENAFLACFASFLYYLKLRTAMKIFAILRYIYTDNR